jgi:hypothetical protein
MHTLCSHHLTLNTTIPFLATSRLKFNAHTLFPSSNSQHKHPFSCYQPTAVQCIYSVPIIITPTQTHELQCLVCLGETYTKNCTCTQRRYLISVSTFQILHKRAACVPGAAQEKSGRLTPVQLLDRRQHIRQTPAVQSCKPCNHHHVRT